MGGGMGGMAGGGGYSEMYGVSGMGGMAGGMMGGGIGGGMYGGMGAMYSEDYSGTGSASTTVLTIRVKKSDVDDFAKDKLDFEKFQKKVDIFTY